jgi:hypothetical protein
MPETCAAGAQTEVLLHAEVAADGFAIESADLVQAVALDVHAWTEGERDLDRRARIAPCEEQVQRADATALGQQVPRRAPRIRRDAAATGEGRNGADVMRGVRVSRQPVEPIVGHLGIAVQEHDVAILVQRCGAVDGRRESLSQRLLYQREAPLGGLLAKPASERWLGRGIVDDDQLECLLLRVREHAFEALPGFGFAAIHGDDDVDAAHDGRPPINCRARMSGQRSHPLADSR